MTKARFNYITLRKYIEGLLAGSKELDEGNDCKVKVYQLHLTNFDVDRLNEMLDKLGQSIDSGDEI